jgi:hypothetical protein
VRRGRVIVLASLVAAFVLAAPVTAAAQSASIFVFGNGAHVIRQTGLAGSVSGHVVVSFRGDAASGCRALGVCDYSGTVIWNPGRSVDLEVVKLRVHKRIEYTAFASFGIGPSSDESTTARVQRNVDGLAAGRCVDAEPQYGGLSGVSVRDRTLALQLFDHQSSLLATRCAGPRDGDLSSAGPRLMLPVGELLRGERRIDLRRVRAFATHGFAGTVTSTVTLRLGKPRNAGNGGGGGFPSGVKTVRTRIVTERLSLVRLRGTVTESFHGSPNADVCALLDSCGALGTITLRPTSHAPTAQLIASGPARLRYRDFLVALGVLPGSPTPGIGVDGSVTWDDNGTAVEHLLQPSRCSGAGRLSDGSVSIDVQRTRAVFSYSRFESLDTECPGPIAAAVNAPSSLLSGAAARRILGARTFTVVVNRGSSLQDDGYIGSVHGSLGLTLRRGRLTQQVITEPR